MKFKKQNKTIEVVIVIERGVVSVLAPKTQQAEIRVLLHDSDTPQPGDVSKKRLKAMRSKPHLERQL